MLKLKRPLIIFDVETTGLNIAIDRIISLAIKKVDSDFIFEDFYFEFNPEHPITVEASEVHGLPNEMLKDSPPFRDVFPTIKEIFEGCDIGGYNSDFFDIPIFMEEMLRVDPTYTLGDAKTIDVGTLFKVKEKRTLEAAMQFYCNKDIENAHNASADVDATYEVLLAQIARYDLSGNIDELSDESKYDSEIEYVDYAKKLYKNKDGIVCFAFGKNKDQSVKDYTSYVEWMARTGTFTQDTISKANAAINGI